MRKLQVFNLITLDGYFSGPGGDLSWHRVDEEFQRIAVTNSNSGNTLIFGRVTYELMARYWSTQEALKNDPLVASGMNRSPKIVFSRTLSKADWGGTRLEKGDLLGEIRKLKQEPGKNLMVLGSGSLVSQLAQAGLIDEYQLMVVPVAIGRGRPLFEGMKDKLNLKLIQTQAFNNGNLLLTYVPAASAHASAV